MQTEPQGARVLLDGRDLGRLTPIEHEVVWIPPFTDDRVIRFDFVMEGYQRLVRWRNVMWSTTCFESATLTPLGTPTFLDDSRHGEWCEMTLVDGRPSTPQAHGFGWTLMPGEHDIEVRNGYEFRLRVARGRFTLPPETQFEWEAMDVAEGRVDAIRDFVVRDETPTRTEEEDRLLEERVRAAFLHEPTFASCPVRVKVKSGIVDCETTCVPPRGEGGGSCECRRILSSVPGVAFVNDHSDSPWSPRETEAGGSPPPGK